MVVPTDEQRLSADERHRDSHVLEHKTGKGAGARAPSVTERTTPAMFDEGDRFAAYVAHELRTPLATQRALLELALGDPNADAGAWREIGGDILRACRHQERLLEGFLTLTHARSQRGPEPCEPVDLATVAADGLRAHDLGELERVVVLEPAWTTGDPTLLERLVVNLVSNAIHHNIGGGRIEIATRTTSARAVLSVANSGPFVPAGELPRLFQPFQRLNPTPRTFSEGIGLGLAIVEAIAVAHSALVTARTRAAGGLNIDVSFPATFDRNAGC
jgi:signal transduction histidine kinase